MNRKLLILLALAITVSLLVMPLLTQAQENTCGNKKSNRIIFVATDPQDILYYTAFKEKYKLNMTMVGLASLSALKLDPSHDIILMPDPNYDEKTISQARIDAGKLQDFILHGGVVIAGLNGASLMQLVSNLYPSSSPNCTGIIYNIPDYNARSYQCLKPGNPIWQSYKVELSNGGSIVFYTWHGVILIPLNLVWAYIDTKNPLYLEILYHALCLASITHHTGKPLAAYLMGMAALAGALLLTIRNINQQQSGQAEKTGTSHKQKTPPPGGSSGSPQHTTAITIPPEYTRISPEEALTHPLRRKIVDEIEKEGALTFNELWRRIGVSKATLNWHLSLLSRLDILEDIRYKRQIFFYTNPAKLIEKLARHDKRFCDIIHLIGDGWPLKEITQHLGLGLRGLEDIYEILAHQPALLQHALNQCP